MNRFFDKYSVGARVLAGVIVAAPIVIALFTGAPKFYSNMADLLSKGLVSVALLSVLALTVRFMGRRIEPGLWGSWGGAPTTRLMRWRDGGRSNEWKRKLHGRVLDLTGIKLLDADEEQADRDEADRRIAETCGLLRTTLRDTKRASLLRKANMEYGLVRNLLGSRWLLIGNSLLAVVVNIVGWCCSTAAAPVWGFAVSCAFVLGAWALGFHVLPAHVKQVADRYAEEFWSVVAMTDLCGIETEEAK